MVESTKNYNIRNLFSGIGFLFFSIFGGALIGSIFGVIGSFFYLILWFPIIMGITNGQIIKDSAKYTKTRNTYFFMVTSILATIALYITFHYMRYIGFWGVVTLQAFGDFSDKSLEAGKIVVEYALKEETGYSGFIGYMLYKAQQGVSIGRIFRSNSLNLGPTFTWFYWLFEFGLISFFTIITGKQILNKRFCELCNSWYTEKKHVGSISTKKKIEILNLIKQKDFSGIGAILEENADSPSLEFYLQSCASCEKNNSFLSISEASFVNGKLNFNEISEVTLSPNEKKLLVDGIRFQN